MISMYLWTTDSDCTWTDLQAELGKLLLYTEVQGLCSNSALFIFYFTKNTDKPYFPNTTQTSALYYAKQG